MNNNIIFLLLLLINPIMVLGHSGGTDKNGCHAGSQPYHCHNKKSSSSEDDEVDVLWVVVVIIIFIPLFFIVLHENKPKPKPRINLISSLSLIPKINMICGACGEENSSKSQWCIECGIKV